MYVVNLVVYEDASVKIVKEQNTGIEYMKKGQE